MLAPCWWTCPVVVQGQRELLMEFFRRWNKGLLLFTWEINHLILTTPPPPPAFLHAHLWQKANRRCKAACGSGNITPGVDYVTIVDNRPKESKNRISYQTGIDINYLTYSYLTESDIQFSITELRKFRMSAEHILLRQVVDGGEQLVISILQRGKNWPERVPS